MDCVFWSVLVSDAWAFSTSIALGLRSRAVVELVLRSRVFSFPRSEAEISALESSDPDDDVRDEMLG
jgi:hypothetical protein